MSFIGEAKIFVDGGCRGNPGPGAIAIVILNQDRDILEEYSDCIGSTTNHRAEYTALIKGLDLAAKYTRHKVVCYSDCQLVINQMTGVWRLRDTYLRGLYHQAKDFERPFNEVVYQKVNRKNHFIKKCDRLLNSAFEGRTVRGKQEKAKK